MSSTAKSEVYRFEVRPLSEEDGGGFLASFPDLPGYMSDGETYEQAIANARDAFAAWIAAYEEEGRAIPAPTGHDQT
jgi:antitoxin HicB